MSTYIEASGSSQFSVWLKSISPNPKPLAWCHTTDGYALRSLINTGFFLPKPCPIFGEDLFYFFYGRPAYRFHDKNSMQISARAPVVIVLSPEVVGQGKRLFPFDTGAFADGLYKKWIHKEMNLADFEMECPSDAPQRHVAAFFGTNANYLQLKAQEPISPAAGFFEIESLAQLLSDRDITEADDRRLAIEIQIDHPIPLKHPDILAIILPDELIDASFMQEFKNIIGSSVELVGYALSPLKKASDYQAILEMMMVDIQKKWRLE